MALSSGKGIVEARRLYNKDKKIAFLAGGGMVHGFSPHSRADNIPAWLTAQEYVQPVDAVRHYGVEFMDAVRERKLPKDYRPAAPERLARGGPVPANPFAALRGARDIDRSWPFWVDISKTKIPDVVVPGGGVGFGNLHGGRGWRWEVAALDALGFHFHPSLGQTTGGGHAAGSWHYKGRAVDLSPPSMAAFNAIKSHYGSTTLELIYGPAGVGIKNGRPHNYGAALNAEHMNHIHWAYGQGGLVKPRTAVYDQGGPLHPGATLAINRTGRTEHVVGPGGTVRLDRRDLVLLAQHIAQATAGAAVHIDGRRVAEVVNGYADLPGGL
jgi:hypothetical protein